MNVMVEESSFDVGRIKKLSHRTTVLISKNYWEEGENSISFLTNSSKCSFLLNIFHCSKLLVESAKINGLSVGM